MTQLTFAEAEYSQKKRKTRRELFLERMEAMIPWSALEKKLSRHYAKPGKQGGRPAYPLATMLRIHCLQLFYNLSDPAMEEALYEIESMRRFAGVRLDRVPDETTILNFRHRCDRRNCGLSCGDELDCFGQYNLSNRRRKLAVFGLAGALGSELRQGCSAIPIPDAAGVGERDFLAVTLGNGSDENTCAVSADHANTADKIVHLSLLIDLLPVTLSGSAPKHIPYGLVGGRDCVVCAVIPNCGDLLLTTLCRE